jgi:hypothetical protein
MGVNRTKPSAKVKAAVLLLAVVALGFGGRELLKKDQTCPNENGRWLALGYPQRESTVEAISDFASKEQSLTDIEQWSRNLECSGNRKLLGRVLAAIKQKNNSLKLSWMFLGIAGKSPKTSGPKAGSELQEIFSSAEAQKAFPKSIVGQQIKEVSANSKSFPKALYEIILRSLHVETAAEFRSQTRLTELLRVAK